MILYVVSWLNKNPYVMYTSYVMFRISRERLTFYSTNMQASSTNPCKRPIFWYIVCVCVSTNKHIGYENHLYKQMSGLPFGRGTFTGDV